MIIYSGKLQSVWIWKKTYASLDFDKTRCFSLSVCCKTDYQSLVEQDNIANREHLQKLTGESNMPWLLCLSSTD